MRGTTNANYRFGETVGSGYVTVQPIKNLTANGNDGNINLSWDALSFNVVTTTTKIDIRYKPKTDANTYFSSVTDGTLATSIPIIIGTNVTSYTITNVTAGQEYLVSVVAWGYVANVGTSSLVPATSAEQIVSVTPSVYKTWSVVIDESNSNPLSCCTYADDAVGMTKGSDDWDAIFGHKPCVFYQGSVYKYLKPDDFTTFEDGTNATSYIQDNNSSGYDVMIEFPRMGLKIEREDNSHIRISITNNPNDSSFEYRAHKRGDVAKNAFYFGAYEAYKLDLGISSGSISSVSGRNPAREETGQNFISMAQARGSGYEICAFYQLLYIQCLYILKYGNLNSQNTIGYGFVEGTSPTTTGRDNALGMDYGQDSEVVPMKLFGIENLWGNVSQLVAGAFCADGGSTYILYTTTSDFGVPDTTSSDPWEYSYNIELTNSSINETTFLTQVQGTTDSGFIKKSGISGSASTYYCDQSLVQSNAFIAFGGYWGTSMTTGIFYNAWSAPQYSSSTVGTRLMYL